MAKSDIERYYHATEKQPTLFEDKAWEGEWQGMPEFVQPKLEPYATVLVRFASEEDMQAFAQLVGQPLTTRSKSLWYPAMVRGLDRDKRYVDES